ncbi:MAG: carbohydrate ABC transporter permease [Clostridia bacterium]|nr:carbohydrate ABC transporter permease [Clostridia bacterium]
MMTEQRAISCAVRRSEKGRGKKICMQIAVYFLMTAIAFVLLFPYFYMIVKSLMTAEEAENFYGSFFPAVPQFINYVTVFRTGGYGEGILWTMSIILFNLVAIPFSATLIGYSFAKLRWKGRGVMFAIMLGTMMLPSAVTQLPLYIIFSRLGFLNTILPFTFPNLFGGSAVFIFLVVQFMRGIPIELENAAKIDGANTFTRYARIVLPLCKPILIYVMVQVFLSYWGDYYGPLVYLTAADAPKTLALVLYNFVTDNSTGTKINILMAGAVFMSVIPTVLFGIFQKQLIEGVTMSGLKG